MEDPSIDGSMILKCTYRNRVRTGFVWLRIRFHYMLKAGDFLCRWPTVSLLRRTCPVELVAFVILTSAYFKLTSNFASKFTEKVNILLVCVVYYICTSILETKIMEWFMYFVYHFNRTWRDRGNMNRKLNWFLRFSLLALTWWNVFCQIQNHIWSLEFLSSGWKQLTLWSR